MSKNRRNKDKRRRKRRQSRASYKHASAAKETACTTKDHSVSMTPSTMSSGQKITKSLDCKVAKVDDTLGLVFGWAIVCTEGGEPYVDLHNDYIPDHAMLKASTKFAKGLRIGGDMHACEDGVIVHTMPLTADIAKAFGIECDKTGLMIALEPADIETLKKFSTGERTGFSIGGTRIKDTQVEL